MSAAKPSSKKAPDPAPAPQRVELLFEIGAEEIPAGMLPRAVEELKTILEKHLTAENLIEGVTLETFGAPRPPAPRRWGHHPKESRYRKRSYRPAQVRRLRQCRRADKSGGQLRRKAACPAPRTSSCPDSQGRIHCR